MTASKEIEKVERYLREEDPHIQQEKWKNRSKMKINTIIKRRNESWIICLKKNDKEEQNKL